MLPVHNLYLQTLQLIARIYGTIERKLRKVRVTRKLRRGRYRAPRKISDRGNFR